jgi:hypothetical protein
MDWEFPFLILGVFDSRHYFEVGQEEQNLPGVARKGSSSAAPLGTHSAWVCTGSVATSGRSLIARIQAVVDIELD